MKTLPEPQLCGFFWFLVMHMHMVLAQCPTYWQVYNNFVSNLWQYIFYMSLLEVKWTIPHIGQNRIKNTTLYIQGQCLLLTHQLFQVSFLLPSFGRVIKISLNKM